MFYSMFLVWKSIVKTYWWRNSEIERSYVRYLYILNAVRCPYVRTEVRTYVRPSRWAWPAQ